MLSSSDWGDGLINGSRRRRILPEKERSSAKEGEGHSSKIDNQQECSDHYRHHDRFSSCGLGQMRPEEGRHVKEVVQRVTGGGEAGMMSGFYVMDEIEADGAGAGGSPSREPYESFFK